ncbi:hypothetical protein CHARACLAT_000519 [Characodon lateralis]|uniref:Uncharacterized protein n=1 Tax=Characodon lateralis TaxID=208331 RepID=A0ABU7CLS3_9TELE|nr:hypothetical protein [Characodon lateralis]
MLKQYKKERPGAVAANGEQVSQLLFFRGHSAVEMLIYFNTKRKGQVLWQQMESWSHSFFSLEVAFFVQ